MIITSYSKNYVTCCKHTLYNDILGLGGILPQYLPPNGVLINDSTFGFFISVNKSKCSWKHLIQRHRMYIKCILSSVYNIFMIKRWYATLCTDTYSGGVPSKSKFSNSSFTRSFSLAMNVKVHCWITLSGFRNTGALKLPFFDFARLVDSNVISQAEKEK